MRSPQVFHLLRRFVLLEKHLKKLELKYFWGIDLTLERAWNSLKWNEKLSLVLSVVRGITSSADMSRNNLKESSTDDSTIQLYEQLSFSYPSLQQPLFHERDTDNSVDVLHQNSPTTHQPVAASSSSTGLSVNP
ncbi:hypothetical protein ACSBR2_002234 [Camellia fascicularis]